MAKGSGTRSVRPKAPANTYWRGDVLFARFKVRGHLHRESLRTGSPAVAAKRVKALKEAADDAAIYGIAQPVSWMAAVVAWRAASPANSTTARYATSLAQLRPWLDPLDVQQVTHDTLRTIVSARRKLVTIATVNRDLTAVSSVLDFAVGENWRQDNAAATFDRSRLIERRDPIILPDAADVATVITAATGAFGAGITVARRTGMRQGEVFGLEHRRVDAKRRAATLFITKRGRPRTVGLDAESLAAIAAQPVYLGCPFVFWHGAGEPFTSPAENWRNLIARVAQKEAQAGRSFRPFRFHDLRHLFAVEFLRECIGTIYDLQIVLGHASLKTTELYLAFLTPDERKAATDVGTHSGAQMQRLEKRLGEATSRE